MFPPQLPDCNGRRFFKASSRPTDDVRRCFFHDCLGSIRQHHSPEIIGPPERGRFRSELNIAAKSHLALFLFSLHSRV